MFSDITWFENQEPRRDLNAVINILHEAVRRGSGFDEMLNTCGQTIRPNLFGVAVGLVETGTQNQACVSLYTLEKAEFNANH